MVKIFLENNNVRAWQRFSCGYVKGFAFWDTELLQAETLCRKVAEAWEENRLDECLYRLNGSFGMVLMREGQCLLVADKLKTYPLLYYKTENGYAVTDSGIMAWETIGDRAFSELSVCEYLSVGHVGENRTLLQGCRVVPAASYVWMEEGQAREKSYDRPVEKHAMAPIPGQFALSTVLEKMTERMWKIADGRPVAIPLSGGYDSRLVACMCRKYGFPRVICYTYGIKESPEVAVSRKVADQLDLEWHFVEYTSEKWARFIESPDFEGYLHYGGNLKSIAHIQDIVAVRELKEKKLLPEDALIMPGHSGDMLGGSHFSDGLTQHNIAKRIFDKYFNVNFLTAKSRKCVLQALASELENAGEEEESLLEAFFDWGVRNRQSNLIVNSVRAYEYEGFDWYLPLWDDAFVRYWRSIPCRERKGSSLYNEALFNICFKPYKVDFRKDKGEVSRPMPIRVLRGIFSAEQRYLLKEGLKKMGVGFLEPERNALDEVGKLLQKKDFCKKDPHVRHVKTDSMGMKALYYLSLLRKMSPRG